MAEATLNFAGPLSGFFAYDAAAGTKTWSTTTADSQVPPALVASGGRANIAVTIYSTGRVRIDISGTRSDRDFTSAVETSGIFTLAAGGRSVDFGILGADFADPYDWTPTNAAEIRAFYNAIGTANVAATFTIRDFAPTPPGATVVIDTAPRTVDSQGTVNLAATVTPLPGTTIVSHAWTATGGAFANPAIEDAVWVAPWRPLGSGETPYTLTLTVTDSAGRVTSAEVVFMVREVPEIDLAIGDSGPVAGIAVAGSGPIRGMAIVGPDGIGRVVYRKRFYRNTLVSRNTDLTRMTQATARNTVTGTRSTNYGGSSHYTSTGSRSTQTGTRSTSTGSRSTQAGSRSTSDGSRSTSTTRSTSAGTRSTSAAVNTRGPSRTTNATRITQYRPNQGAGDDPYRLTGIGPRSTASIARRTNKAFSTSAGTRSTSASRQTSGTRSTSATARQTSTGSRNTEASSRLTSTGRRLTGSGGGSRTTTLYRSTEATTRATVIGSRNTSFTRITEI